QGQGHPGGARGQAARGDATAAGGERSTTARDRRVPVVRAARASSRQARADAGDLVRSRPRRRPPGAAADAADDLATGRRTARRGLRTTEALAPAPGYCTPSARSAAAGTADRATICVSAGLLSGSTNT